ncbi:hypothetical protein PPH41_33900, partial [Burkholderia gladioli]|nr:hypothetical protein [Burkholderia gladioli]
ADLWRWFSLLVDERRIRWCQAGGQWLVSVDHRHVATEESFDRAVREARLAAGRERAYAIEREEACTAPLRACKPASGSARSSAAPVAACTAGPRRVSCTVCERRARLVSMRRGTARAIGAAGGTASTSAGAPPLAA